MVAMIETSSVREERHLNMNSMAMAKARKNSRYKVIEQVGVGDFAKVYSAEDTKLGRKVAIKQIHKQYLEDQKKLDRYWKEAQLLVELEHPNVMTIYDVVKERGCLVLELMKGNLKQLYGDKPMPVSDVREMIIEVCKGLECLHKNGIIHGDIKPANLMQSRSGVVKLGDFGLARRASDAEGSLVKGTTKYMAPELVSEEFGDVGPRSDLYSLGFAALELLVGPDFDSLFPDLVAFGRDPQMAWMMWHCSKDRRFPPIKKVLDGVPDDLATVLDRLTCKDQSQRFESARDAISHLKSGAKPVGESIKEEEARLAALAKKQKNKRRMIAAAACFSSLLVSGIIVWMTRDVPKPVAPKEPAPLQGIIQNVLGRDAKFVIDPGDNDWKEYTLMERDSVTLNRKTRQLRDLKVGDRVVVYTHFKEEDEKFKKWFEVVAFRPERHSGVIESVNVDEGKIAFLVKDGDDDGQKFDLNVTEETQIIVNKQPIDEEAPLLIGDLAPNDIVDVQLSDDVSGMLAVKVDAIRDIELKGVIRKLEPSKGRMTIAKETGGAEELVVLPVDVACTYSLNGVKSIEDQLLGPGDIKIGDRVTVKHNVKISSIDAYRPFEDIGRITNIGFAQNEFTLKSQKSTAPITYRIDSKTQLLLSDEVVTVDALRPGDEVQLVHEMPDATSPTILSANIVRPLNRNRWAILIGNDKFDAADIPAMGTSVANVAAIKEELITRFAVPESQVKTFENEARVRLEQELPQMIKRAANAGEIYVYVSTRGYVEEGKDAYLATRDFKSDAMGETGIKLDWLIDLLDSSGARKKMLLLDCATDEKAGDSIGTTACEMVQHVQSGRRGGYPKYTYVFANAREGQGSIDSANSENQSLFGEALAEAFSGMADKERDSKVEITELAKYVSENVSVRAGGKQSPMLFTPDDRPPRLSDRIQGEIVQLLSEFSNRNRNYTEVLSRGASISSAAGGEPEPIVAAGLICIKRGKMTDALPILEAMRLKHQDYLLGQQVVIWIHFYKRDYVDGAEKLAQMLDNIPVPEKDEVLSENVLEKLTWAGKLRELAGDSADWNDKEIPPRSVLSGCDTTVAALGTEAVKRYQAGRSEAKKRIQTYRDAVKTNPQSNEVLMRKRIGSYVDAIASPQTIQEIQDGLDDE